ncbi:thioesterase superfamily protein, partial [Vibrio parahaemolyticus 10296]
YL